VVDNKFLFVNTLEDIRSKTKTNNKYDIIKASGLLRLLLLDNPPLIHIINKEYRIPILFHVSDFKSKIPIQPDYHWISLLPETRKTYKVKLDEFLNITCFLYKQNEYSIKDVIRSCAHLIGGIHTSKPRDEKEEIFLNLDKIMPINPDGTYNSLKEIALVGIKGLETLEEKVKLS